MLSPQTYDVDDGSELLLALLTPEAISRTWPDLRVAIESALPPLSHPTQALDRMTSVLESLLTGRLVCHALYKIIDGQVYSFGIVVTAVVYSYESTQNNLLIYALYAHPKYITGDYGKKFIDKMNELAVGNRCKSIIYYTARTELILATKRLGGNADYTMCTLEVDYGR